MHPEPRQIVDIPVFSTLNPDELEAICGWVDVEPADPGRRLTIEGAAGYAFFVLQDGSASVTRDGEEINHIGPGDFFGEMAILGSGRRSATVTVTSPSTVLVMFGTRFRQLEMAMPGVAEKIRQAATVRADR